MVTLEKTRGFIFCWKDHFSGLGLSDLEPPKRKFLMLFAGGNEMDINNFEIIELSSIVVGG